MSTKAKKKALKKKRQKMKIKGRNNLAQLKKEFEAEKKIEQEAEKKIEKVSYQIKDHNEYNSDAFNIDRIVSGIE